MDPEQHRQLRARAEARRQRLVSHRARGFREAEEWDLAFWQAQTPTARLAALIAIREDVRKARAARRRASR
jgi:hypothetical protein